MMPRRIAHRLRVFAIVAICGVLSACCSLHRIDKAIAEGHLVWCSPDDRGIQGCFTADKDSPICPITYNVMQCRFDGADLMGESSRQFRELHRALKDALELPIEELQKPRYADFTGTPNQWTFGDIIDSHYPSGGLIRGWGRASTSTDGFYPSLKLPESVPILKQLLKEAEAAIEGAFTDE